VIEIGSERIRCPEPLFQPLLIESQDKGLAAMVYQAVISSPADIKNALCKNIMLSGGISQFPRIANRLQQDLSKLGNLNAPVNVIASPSGKYATWLGGSILASLSLFSALCVSKNEYDELGKFLLFYESCRSNDL
jgi:actin-related protein